MTLNLPYPCSLSSTRYPPGSVRRRRRTLAGLSYNIRSRSHNTNRVGKFVSRTKCKLSVIMTA